MSPQECSLSTRLQPGTVGLTPLFTTGYSNFKNSGSFYFCNQRTVGVCAQSYACLTAVENICLERTRWSTADIWLLHNKGWGWTPNKQHTHTLSHTHTHIKEAHRWRCKRRTKQDNKDFKVILRPRT